MRPYRLLLAIALISSQGCASPQETRATDPLDPLVVAPENYSVLLENERVRVLDFRLPAGKSEGAHRHPTYLAYALGDFEMRFTLADGSTVDRRVSAGAVIWNPAVIHSSMNTGATEAHALLIELK